MIGASFYAYLLLICLHCVSDQIHKDPSILYQHKVRRQYHYQFKKTFVLFERGFICDRIIFLISPVSLHEGALCAVCLIPIRNSRESFVQIDP